MRWVAFFCLVILGIVQSSYATDVLTLKEYVGWTILDVKEIESYKDPGTYKTIGFDGCKRNRVIYFSDGTQAVCRSQSTAQGIRLKAILLQKEKEYQIVVRSNRTPVEYSEE